MYCHLACIGIYSGPVLDSEYILRKTVLKHFFKCQHRVKKAESGVAHSNSFPYSASHNLSCFVSVCVLIQPEFQFQLNPINRASGNLTTEQRTDKQTNQLQKIFY